MFINPTGNPGMATGGTGDVLTGMIAAWLAQLLDAEAACRLAVFLHGAAGDLAEAREGQVAMIATDLLDHLGEALTSLAAGPPRRERTRESRITTLEEETAARRPRAGRDAEGRRRAAAIGDLGAGKTAFVRGLASGSASIPRTSAARRSRSCTNTAADG